MVGKYFDKVFVLLSVERKLVSIFFKEFFLLLSFQDGLHFTRTTEESPVKSPPARKRRRDRDSWEKVKRKRRRNKGEQYTSGHSKNIVPARKIGEPCTCPKKCWNKIKGDTEFIFNSFWDLADYATQNTYIMQNIGIHNTKRSYTKGQSSRRSFTFSYKLKVNSVDISVCKMAFLAVHGLHRSRKRIELLQGQIKTGNVTAKSDGRGKHHNRPIQGDGRGTGGMIHSTATELNCLDLSSETNFPPNLARTLESSRSLSFHSLSTDESETQLDPEEQPVPQRSVSSVECLITDRSRESFVPRMGETSSFTSYLRQASLFFLFFIN